jgi:hypothetical protein
MNKRQHNRATPEPAIDRWLSPKITATSRDFERRFDAVAHNLARTAAAGPATRTTVRQRRWLSYALGCGALAAAVTLAFLAADRRVMPLADAPPAVPTALASLFELDAQLGPALAVLDAETFVALVNISHENLIH